ncbi:MAG: dihydrofolate reductase family protein [Actinobacteria bacterium]|nr:dihydrofolate reductase family protein [Actinomycetota bacterium]
MRELHPHPHEVDDVLADLAADERPVPSDRPWVMANMVTSIDGAYAMEGRSGGLGTPGDKMIFHALRGLADIVLVGAATAREEHYRRPSSVPAAMALRRDRGQQPAPRLVLVSRSGRVPDDQPFLTGEGPDPLLVHPAGSPVEVPEGIETMSCGTDGGVDLVELLRRLRGEGHQWVLTEGGPGLLGQLHRADLIDELLVTTSPNLVGGGDVGLLGHGDAFAQPRSLHRLWMDDQDALFANYRR